MRTLLIVLLCAVCVAAQRFTQQDPTIYLEAQRFTPQDPTIYVKTLTGLTITLGVDLDETIGEIKYYQIASNSQIMDVYGPYIDDPEVNFELIYAGRTLQNSWTIGQYNIPDGATIYLVFRP